MTVSLGVPFSGNINHGVDQRLMAHQLTRILKQFHAAGWRLVASADISAKYLKTNNQEFPLDTHSWFFLHDPENSTAQTGEGDTEDQVEIEMDQLSVDEIKSEKSRWRIFLRVHLPFAIILLFIASYALSVLGFV